MTTITAVTPFGTTDLPVEWSPDRAARFELGYGATVAHPAYLVRYTHHGQPHALRWVYTGKGGFTKALRAAVRADIMERARALVGYDADPATAVALPMEVD